MGSIFLLKPNLYILGAPKCGTTSLFNWLAQQEQIFTPRIKEPHYFYSPYGNKIDAADYYGLYKDAKQTSQYALDASVWYLFSKTAVPRILSEIEAPRFIVCLRNPLELAPSLHSQKIYSTHETVEDFSAAWALSDERFKGEFSGIQGLPPSADPSHMSYRHASSLGVQSQWLLETVDPKDIYFCFLDEISKNPELVFSNLCNFLGITPSVKTIFRVENRAKDVRSRKVHTILRNFGRLKRNLGIKKATGVLTSVHNANRKITSYAKPSAELEHEMRMAFSDDVTLLQNLTGRNLSHWLKPDVD